MLALEGENLDYPAGSGGAAEAAKEGLIHGFSGS